MLGCAGKHTQGGACCLSCWILGCPLCCSPSSGLSLSPGVAELVTGLYPTPASLQTAVGSTGEREWAKRSRKQQEKVTRLWDWLHVAVPVGGCHLPGNQAQGASECQAWPQRGPRSTMPSSCLYEVQLTPKRANPALHPQHVVP